MNKSSILAVCLITVSCIGIYSNSLGNPFIWDDELLIKQNPLIKNRILLPDIFTTDLFHSANRPSNFYRPLQSLTLSIDYHFWKLNPFGYHLTNLMLHLLVSLLVYFLILAVGKHHLVSLLAGLLFAVHPIHTEAVTYIAGRAESLTALFLLLSMLFYLKSSKTNYLLSILFFIPALLSKELALIFPFILILYEGVFRKNRQNFNFKKILPFIAIALIYLYFRFFYLAFFEENLSFQFNRDYFLKIAGSIKIIFSYLGLLLFPHRLQMERIYPLVKSFWDPLFLLCLFLLSALIWTAAKTYKKSKFIFFFSFWFFIFLLPSLNLIKLNALMAEHWLYLPSIGFFALSAWGLGKLVKRNIFFIFLFIPFFLYFSLSTVSRNFEWGDEANFYKKILNNNTNNARIWYNLGTVYLKKGELKEAEKAFQKTLTLRPRYAQALVNLGTIYFAEGKLKEAEHSALKAIRSEANSAEAFCLLGDIYAKRKLLGQAEENYLQAINVNPFFYNSYLNLGVFFAREGKIEEAALLWKKALELNPESFEAQYNLRKAENLLSP